MARLIVKSRLMISIMISLSLIPFFFFFKWYFYETPAPLSVPQISIGFVNLSVIRNEGLVFKSFKDLLDEHYKNYHSELLTEEENLRKNYNEIKRLESAGKKTTTELQTQRSALDQKVVELEKKIRDKREKLNARLAIIKDEIEETIQKIIIDVSEERHLNLVFNATVMDARVLLYGDKEFDITPEVLEKLDNQLPKVHL